MRLLALSLIFSLFGGLSAQAQSVTGCERKQTEEEYQKCIERSGGNQGYDPQDWGAGTVTPPTQDPIPQDKKDQLPPESQQQISREMAKKVYAQVPEWTPETRNQDFEYEPSEAAKSDPDLKAREEAAFAEAVSKYHAREQKAYDARQGGGAGTGDGQEAGAGGGNGNVSVGGDVNAPDAGEGGQAGGDPNGQSRSAMDILGDLNVIGDPSGDPGDPSEMQGDGSGGAEGERQVIAGDVTIGSEQGSAGEQGGERGSGQGPEGQTGTDGETGSSGQEQNSAGEQTEQVTSGQEPDGQGQTADQPTQSAAAGSDSAAQQPPGSTQENPAGTSGTPSDQAGAEQANAQQPPEDPQQANANGAPGEPSTSMPPRDADAPPPAPSRPIPPADPIAAAILASLFDDAEESGGEDGEPSAPFIDWTDPDAAEKIKEAASVIAEDTPPPPAAPSALTLPPDQDQAARVLDKEEARIAYQEATLGDAALSADAKANLEQQVTARKDALAQASAQAGPIPAPQSTRIPPQANARLSKMTLP